MCGCSIYCRRAAVAERRCDDLHHRVNEHEKRSEKLRRDLENADRLATELEESTSEAQRCVKSHGHMQADWGESLIQWVI